MGIGSRILLFYPLLNRRVIGKNKHNSNYQELEVLKHKADSIITKWFILENNSEEEIEVLSELLNESEINEFFNATSANSSAAEIITNLKISWDIYARWRKDSHADRISYMRNNFLTNYKKSNQRKGEEPKVFLKFGQLHASQIISNGTYDLGHFVNELAKNNGRIVLT